MALDEQLLNKSDNTEENIEGENSDFDTESDSDFGSDSNDVSDSDDDSADFRAAKKEQAPSGPDGNNSQVNDFAAVRQEARRRAAQKEAQEEKKDGDGEEISAETAAARKATDSCLRQSFLNLIPSGGTSLLYPNIHLFLRTIGWQKIFGPISLKLKLGGILGKIGKKIGVDKADGCSGGLVLLSCLDLGCLLLIFGILTIIALILNVITNPLQVLKAVLSYLGTYLWK